MLCTLHNPSSQVKPSSGSRSSKAITSRHSSSTSPSQLRSCSHSYLILCSRGTTPISALFRTCPRCSPWSTSSNMRLWWTTSPRGVPESLQTSIMTWCWPWQSSSCRVPDPTPPVSSTCVYPNKLCPTYLTLYIYLYIFHIPILIFLYPYIISIALVHA